MNKPDLPIQPIPSAVNRYIGLARPDPPEKAENPLRSPSPIAKLEQVAILEMDRVLQRVPGDRLQERQE
jgi:hypothetical protein